DITFAGTIQGPGSLKATASGTGNVTLGDGSLGAALAFATISGTNLTLNGMATSGPQSYTATGAISFGGNFTTDNAPITFTSPTATLSANATVHAGTVSGRTAINGGSVTTSGDQTYNGAVTLNAITILSGVNVTFASTIDSTGSARDLEVDASGATTLGGDVGAILALNNLTTDGPGTTVFGTTNPITISTSQDQTYGDNVSLAQNATLAGNDIVFSKKVDGGFALTVNTSGSGSTTFTGAVGSGIGTALAR